MENRDHKNWNNFFLGLIIAILPLLRLPASLKNIALVVAGLLVALFSLARFGRGADNFKP